MVDELRLVQTTFGELAENTRFTVVDRQWVKTSSTTAEDEVATYDVRLDLPVLAILPAAPPIDLALLQKHRINSWSTCRECGADRQERCFDTCEWAAVIAMLEGKA